MVKLLLLVIFMGIIRYNIPVYQIKLPAQVQMVSCAFQSVTNRPEPAFPPYLY